MKNALHIFYWINLFVYWTCSFQDVLLFSPWIIVTFSQLIENNSWMDSHTQKELICPSVPPKIFLAFRRKKSSSESVTKRAFRCCPRFLFSMNDAMHVIRRILQPAPAHRRLAARRRLQITILSLREPPLGCEVESHIRNDKKISLR